MKKEDIHWTQLPNQLNNIIKAIKKSEYISTLQDDWDDEGSKGFLKSTWLRAANFLAYYAYHLFTEKERKIIATPSIYEGTNGCIDMIWESENYRLLVRVPEAIEKPIAFYGDDYRNDANKGTVPNLNKIKVALIDSLMSV